MKILVCISSVPDTTTKITFADNNTKFNPAGVQFVINPNDEFGLSRALQIKESNPGSTVTVIHVGSVDSEPVIRKSLAIGADDAVRIDASAVDAVQVANEIASYVKSNPYDLIITGKESIDYNGSIVPHMLGELLGIPSVSPCVGLEIDGATAKMVSVVDGGKENVSASLPVVAGAQKGMVEEKDLRIPNMRGIMQARTKALNVVPASGASGAQVVVNFESPGSKAACKMVDPNNMAELVNLLQNEAKVI